MEPFSRPSLARRRDRTRALFLGAVLTTSALYTSALTATAANGEPDAFATHSAERDEAIPDEPTGALTLRQALAAALLRSPELSAFSLEIRARDARTLQAGLLPNPELGAIVENVGGSGDREAFETTETTLLLSQLLELGGKREKRQRLAELGRDLAVYDYEVKRLSVLSEVTKAFTDVLANQERQTLATELERIASESLNAVNAQVNAGAAPPVEVSRASVALGRAQVGRFEAQRALDTSRAALAGSWAGRALFTRAEGALDALPTVPSRDAVLSHIGDNPQLRRWETELSEREAALALEQAEAVPDVTAGVGGRYFSDNGDAALVFDLSVPLPVLNRNQGAIEEARVRINKARAERAAAEALVRAELSAAYGRLASAASTARELRERILPQAESSRSGALEAYRKGAFRYLDVLDTQRTLFELRADYLTTLQTLQAAAADVERLTATPLHDMLAEGAP